jgi:hypothetical protein
VDPLPALAVPSPASGDEVERGMVLAMAPRRLEDHKGAALEGCATDPAKEIV